MNIILKMIFRKIILMSRGFIIRITIKNQSIYSQTEAMLQWGLIKTAWVWSIQAHPGAVQALRL